MGRVLRTIGEIEQEVFGKKSLRTARLTYEELLTLLIKVEGVLNSRPLTYLCEDGGEPLTPSQLVVGRRLLSNPREASNQVLTSSEDSQGVSRRQRYLKTLLQHFWKTWQRDYLTQLREQHRYREASGPAINVGDAVCVYEDNVKRLNWSMAKVERLLVGKDGIVRAAVVRAIGKSGNPVQLKRPLQRLFPIELQSKKEQETEFPITFVEHAVEEN